MKTINVPDMHCNKCVERITKALNQESLKFEVSLEQKTVSIDGCDHCVATAMETREDIGFTPSVKE